MTEIKKENLSIGYKILSDGIIYSKVWNEITELLIINEVENVQLRKSNMEKNEIEQSGIEKIQLEGSKVEENKDIKNDIEENEIKESNHFEDYN